MSTPIQSLNLTRRATNCLLAEGMTTVEQVTEFIRQNGMNGLLRIPNLGRKWANEIMAATTTTTQAPARRNDGGPAFPLQSIGPDFAPGYAGMSLRDYFAAMVLPVLCADYCASAQKVGFDERWQMGVALDAYAMADAMLAAREGAAQ